MLHVFDPTFAGQVRGVSWLAPIITSARELDELRHALLVQQKTAALFFGVVVDQNDTGTVDPFATPEWGEGIKPGALLRLPGGFDLKTAAPQAASQGVDFLRASQRQIAAGLGVPAHLLSGDVSDANYSSLRASMTAFAKRVEQRQYCVLVPQLVAPVFRRFVRDLAFEGALDGFFDDPTPFTRAEFIAPPLPGVDPQKDASATAEKLRLGLMSRRQAVAELGFDVESLDAEIAADREREARLGLTFGVANA
jgi:lambda family phage portal protein